MSAERTHPAKVVIVTGASGNLGRAVIAELAGRGAHIVGVDRETGSAPAPAGAASVTHVPVDLSDEAAVVSLVKTVLAAHRRLDGVVHTVGGFAFAPIDKADAGLFERMFRLNVVTTVNVLRAAIPAMRAGGGGSIVAVAAGAALRAPSGLSAYAAAKAGVLRLVESFAEETKAEGIRINAVLPSIIDTPQNRADMPKADFTRWVRAEEIAASIGFLLSDAASAITGAAIPLPGRV